MEKVSRMLTVAAVALVSAVGVSAQNGGQHSELRIDDRHCRFRFGGSRSWSLRVS